MEKKLFPVKAMLTGNELKKLDEKVEKCNQTRAGYIRMLVNGAVPRVVPESDYFRAKYILEEIFKEIKDLSDKRNFTREEIASILKRLAFLIIQFQKNVLLPDKVSKVGDLIGDDEDLGGKR